jgi:Mn2+/Fe2+ NRAMP family transporter
LRNLGPGLILAGSIVGSGELIATTRTGAEAHFDFLWLIIIGCIIKVFAQIEFGRHVITFGKSSLESLNELPGPCFHSVRRGRKVRANWILVFWVVMFLSILGQQGGIVGGVGQALAITLPITEQGTEKNRIMSEKVSLIIQLKEFETNGDIESIDLLRTKIDNLPPLPPASDDLYWSLIISGITIIFLLNGRFSLIEKYCIILVSSFTFITILNLIALQSNESWAIKMDEIIHGLSFSFPESKNGVNPLMTALATFGIIGVGASEILVYPYWCTEKGYGAFTGKRDKSKDWLYRAKGWIKVMKWDAWGSMLIYTFCTIAFYLLGASVLGRSGLIPAGSEMIQTLSSMYSPVFGKWAQIIFLIGSVAVLFSTFFVALAGQSRMAVDALTTSGLIPNDQKLKNRLIKGLGVVLPIICVTCYAFFKKPVLLILISGSMQALMLPIVGFAVLYFRYKKSDKRIGYSKIWDFMLWLSFISFLVLGVYQLQSKIFS